MGSEKANSRKKWAQIQNYVEQRLTSYPKYKSLLESLDSLASEEIDEVQSRHKIRRLFNQFLESERKALWQEIVARKEQKLKGHNPEQFQKLINQVPHRSNRQIQNCLRVCKQASNQQKIRHINPFLSSSLLYQVQNSIRQATVTMQRESDDIYLNLVMKQDTYSQAIHIYVLELCEKSLNDWLSNEWHNIYYQYNQGGIDQLKQDLKTYLVDFDDLVLVELEQSSIKPKFVIEEQIELAALRENSRIVFDYNYTHSTWFRLLVASFIGSIIYLVTQRLFGFILLLVQIINLITGQDTKKIRLRQQTKELKRVVDSKYQLLVRSLSEKASQEIAIALDNLGQHYQEQVEAIVRQADQKLQEIKHANYQAKETIEQLKQDQQKLNSIFN